MLGVNPYMEIRVKTLERYPCSQPGAIDPWLRTNQNGFREGRSTVTQILALRRIIEEVKKNNMEAVLCFIDFKKAFDSINRSTMMKILKAYDVPPNIHQAIGSMYTNTRARVMTPDGCSEEFDIHPRPLPVHNSPGLRSTAGHSGKGGESRFHHKTKEIKPPPSCDADRPGLRRRHRPNI